MKQKTFNKRRFVLIPLLCIAFLFSVSFVVMLLWNELMPTIFGMITITLWQAMGLLVLCKLLFGFGGGGPKRGGAPWKRGRVSREGTNLCESEKEKLKQYMNKERCFWEKPISGKGQNDPEESLQ